MGSRPAAGQFLDNAHRQTFAPGFHSKAHLHTTLELMVCVEGRFHGDIRGNSVAVTAGEYLLVFHNVPHSITVADDGPCTLLQVHFHGAGEAPPAEDTVSPSAYLLTELELTKGRFFHGPASPHLRSCVEEILHEQAQEAFGKEEMLRCRIEELSLLLARDVRAHASAWDGTCIYISRAVLYIGAHFSEKLTVSGLADMLGISTRYLNRLFQEQLGLSVLSYLSDVRISRAVDFMRLNPAYPLSQLALDVGFCSQQHFCRTFKEKMGISPGRYFARMQGKGGT